MTIIVEQHLDHWDAWISGNPCHGYTGATAAEAATRLLEASGIDPSLVQATGDPTLTRMELLIPTAPCPDCKGSGKYTGLNTVEDPVRVIMKSLRVRQDRSLQEHQGRTDHRSLVFDRKGASNNADTATNGIPIENR